jgi:replicative DNA helicase
MPELDAKPDFGREIVRIQNELPHDETAEKAVLGSIMLDYLSEADTKGVVHQAISAVRPADFFAPGNQKIFAVMLELAEEGKPIDLVTLSERLTASNNLQAVGGVSYLSDLTSGVMRRQSIDAYLTIVKNLSRRREFIFTCIADIAKMQDTGNPVEGCLNEHNDQILALEAGRAEAVIKTPLETSDAVYEHLKQQAEQGLRGGLIGLSFGVPGLDQATGGMRNGELTLIGGRPGEGKSVLAKQAIVANCEKGIPVALFTPEMTHEQVLLRIWCEVAKINADFIRNPAFMSKDERAKLEWARDHVKKWPLYIDDSSSMDAQEVAARSRLLAKRHDVKLIVADFLQIMDARGRDERERLTKISKTMRQIAKDVVPVLALSQLARAKDGNYNRRPTKYDFKESGSLEQDSHLCVMIYRPRDKESNLPNNEDELIIAKQRNGTESIVPVTFVDRFLRYEDRK